MLPSKERGGTVGGFSRVAFLKITMNVRLVRETCALVATCRHFILFVCRVFCGKVAVVVVAVVAIVVAHVAVVVVGCLAL